MAAGLAELHKGEIIVPAKVGAGAGAVGDTTTNYYQVTVPPPQKALMDEAELVLILRRLGLLG